MSRLTIAHGQGPKRQAPMWQGSTCKAATLARSIARCSVAQPIAIIAILVMTASVHAGSTPMASAAATKSVEQSLGSIYAEPICGVKPATSDWNFEATSNAYTVFVEREQLHGPLESGSQARTIEISNSTPNAPLPPAAVTGAMLLAGNWLAARLSKKRMM